MIKKLLLTVLALGSKKILTILDSAITIVKAHELTSKSHQTCDSVNET